MNALSWLLYLADVADNYKSVIGWCWFFLAVAFFVAAVVYESLQAAWERLGGLARWLAILALIGLFVPGKDTVYAIAASELGEKALRSELTGKAAKALDGWLDRQIGQDQKQAADNLRQKQGKQP